MAGTQNVVVFPQHSLHRCPEVERLLSPSLPTSALSRARRAAVPMDPNDAKPPPPPQAGSPGQQQPPPPPPPPPAFHVKPPDPQKAAKLQECHARDALAAQHAAELAALRRVPQYETGGQQRLGGNHHHVTPDEMALQRLKKLGTSSDPKIARHLKAEEQRKEEAARKRHEEEKKLARARANADKLKAVQALVPSASPGVTAAAAEARMTPNLLRQYIARIEDEALRLLRRIIFNVADHPETPKMRQLRLHNPKLRALFADASACAILSFVGFEQVQINEDNNGVLESYIDRKSVV